ncbi:class I SAM-dependent methyltransferase [Deinococcus multiflagellatus]|uniref:Class I SAM-dependent methyltransferase n=1 Tax=Deinococcus multiflagellatus TaxID=1656887 RepID=A0ABW1ZHA5_9DEIO|nr:class I SAM-dependent methyltransferase [Deinococcus multiflagellatus]MBZ9713679.1 class I SAM-dependent methyltransferase [Deinococcus multiflagellatus]
MNAMPGPPQHQENLNLTLAQRSNLWPPTARAYHAWRARSLRLLGAPGLTLAREAALLRALCRPGPGQQWLDAGTSSGFYAGVLARAGAEVLAADLSAPMLQEAQRRQRGLGIQWAQLNLEASGLPAHRFDGVTVGATLNETHDPARLLAELARLLRPGGQLWLMYLRRTAGPLQAALARPALGGLSFPDPAWVARALPGLRLTHGLNVGAVRFERHYKAVEGNPQELCKNA